MKMNMEKDVFASSSLVLNPTTLGTVATRYSAEVTLNEEPIAWMANAIENAISDASFRDPKPIDIQAGNVRITSISEAFKIAAKVAIGARVYQVAGLPTHFDKKNFEYVALMGPVLGTYGVYHDATEAYDIVPSLGNTLKSDLQDLGCIDKGMFVVPEWYSDVMYIFRRYHLMTGYGLPKETTTDDPSIFKVTVEDNLVIGRQAVGVREVLIACLVSSSKLTDLFGAYRTLYTGLQTVRTTIENIGLKALHDLE